MKTKLPILLLLCFLNTFSFAQPGSLDSTYGVNGHFNDSLSNLRRTSSNVNKILSLSNGGTIVLGDTGWGDFGMVIRCTLKNGSRDASFGINGNAITGVDSTAIGFGACLQTDGKILVAGEIPRDNLYQLLCLRLKKNGTPDSTFGVNGNIVLRPPVYAQTLLGEKISVTQDNKIIIGVTLVDSFYYEYAAVVKLNPNGSPDSSFGNNGLCVVRLDTNSVSARLQFCMPMKNGEICIAGPSVYSNVLAMITAKGQLDSSFGIEGKIRLDSQAFGGLMEQADGKIIATIYSIYASGPLFFKRFNVNGITDSTWGKNGLVQANDGNGALALLPTGSFVAGGQDDSSFVVSRYKPDGSPDSSFGLNGLTHIPASLFNSRINQMAARDMVADTIDKSITFAGHVYGVGYCLFKLKLEGNTAVPFLTTATGDAYLYPNPANSVAILHFSIDKKDALSITVYDINGRAVQAIATQKTFTVGSYDIPLSLSNLRPGIYFVRMQSGYEQQTMRLMKE